MSYTRCPGSYTQAVNVRRTSRELGTKFGGQVWAECPVCGRGVRPLRQYGSAGTVPGHKPRG